MDDITKHIFVVFDVETTGLYPDRGDRIIEIAGIKIVDGKIQEEQVFNTLVNPGRPISPEASEVSKITDAMVTDAPTMADVLPKFLEFIEDSTLVAHNAQFDMSFLQSEMMHAQLETSLPQYQCTLDLSRRIFPYQQQHNLDIVMRRMNVKTTGDRHRALTDVVATAEVFLQFFKHRPDVILLEEEMATR